MSLMEIVPISGKACQNQKYDWHKYPKTLLKIDEIESLHSENQKSATFIITLKNQKDFGIFCYHCCFEYIGKCIIDLRKNGATKEEIQEWINFIKPKTGDKDDS